MHNEKVVEEKRCVIQPTAESRAAYAAYVFAWRRFCWELEEKVPEILFQSVEEFDYMDHNRAEVVAGFRKAIQDHLARFKVEPWDGAAVDDIKRIGIEFPEDVVHLFEDYWYGEGKPGGLKPE